MKLRALSGWYYSNRLDLHSRGLHVWLYRLWLFRRTFPDETFGRVFPAIPDLKPIPETFHSRHNHISLHQSNKAHHHKRGQWQDVEQQQEIIQGEMHLICPLLSPEHSNQSILVLSVSGYAVPSGISLSETSQMYHVDATIPSA